MSTNCSITMKKSENEFISVYCHYDGYPSGVGVFLKKFYTSYNEILNLVSMGYISSLGETIDESEFQHRDMDYDLKIIFGDTWDEIMKKNHRLYNYLWLNGDWYLSMDGNDFILI